MTRSKQAEETPVEDTTPEHLQVGEDQIPLYNLNDGKYGRPPGIYGDDVARREQEINRARLEDREPDLDNPPPYVGDVLVAGITLDAAFNPTAFGGQELLTGERTAPVVAVIPVATEEVPVEDEKEVPDAGDPVPEKTEDLGTL